MADEENLYDEFGNYIGPELSSSSSGSSSPMPSDDESDSDNERMTLDEEEEGEGKKEGRGGFEGIKDGDDNDESSPSSPPPKAEISSRAVVLHEDKKYYPNAEEVYGPDVEIRIEEEDRQSLETPIIKPPTQKSFLKAAKHADITAEAGGDYIAELLQSSPDRVRNISIVGNLGHGKTTFVDMLLAHASGGPPSAGKGKQQQQQQQLERFTDVRKDEQEMKLSIKSSAVSLLLSDGNGESFVLNIVDTPGHPNFADEVTAALRLSDGVVVVVDACEGVMMQTERLIKLAVREKQPVVLVLNKVDRLILDLHLPPADAYHKLRYIIETVNSIIDSLGVAVDQSPENKFLVRRLSPELGNVLFASGEHGWCFSIPTFARIYTERYYRSASAGPRARRQAMLGLSPADPFPTDINNNSNNSERSDEINGKKGCCYDGGCGGNGSAPFIAAEFGARLWGDVYFNAATRTFQSEEPGRETGSSGYRTFVEFVLEPIYKIYSAVLGEDEACVKRVLREGLGIHIRRKELRQDATPLLKTAMARFLSHTSGFVDMVARFVPSPRAMAPIKTRLKLTAPSDSPYARAAAECDPAGPLLVNVTKLFPTPDASRFLALGRVFAGTLTTGARVRVLGEAYTPMDEEDSGLASATRLFLPAGRDTVELAAAPAGSLVLIEGVDDLVVKTATVVDAETDARDQPYAFAPLRFDTCSVMKVAVEPLVPAELPKMLDGLRKINKSYPLCVTKKEESGEHTIVGTGELYLDAVLRDLREVFTEIEVKVSDPVVSFCETVLDTSSDVCTARTQNGLNRIAMIAEQLEAKLPEAIENKEVRIDAEGWRVARSLNKYGWGYREAMSLWAFGPSSQGPNALLNECPPDESEEKKAAVNSVKRFVIQGFQWATREGPLCEERKIALS